TVRGRGAHVLELNFQAPVTGTGEDREIRFGVPEVVQCHLAVDLPAAARLPHTVLRRGAQSVTDQGGRPRLDADVGRATAVHVRWQAAGAQSQSPAAVWVQ